MLSLRAEELKALTEPDVTSTAGTAKSALEIRGWTQRRPLDRKKVEGWARVAARSIDLVDMRSSGGRRVVLEED